MKAEPWQPYFLNRLLNPWLLIYFGLVAPAIIYWSQRQLFVLSSSVWAVNIIASFLLYGAGMISTWIAARNLPSEKEVIALVSIFLITLWSRT
jgi:hypothetical protein